MTVVMLHIHQHDSARGTGSSLFTGTTLTFFPPYPELLPFE